MAQGLRVPPHSMTANHRIDWLAKVAESAGFHPVGAIAPVAGASPEEVWGQIAQRCEISVPRLARLVADHYDLPVADLSQAQSTASGFVPAKVALKHQVFPLRSDYGTIVVATSDPTNLEAEQDVAFAAGRRVSFEVAPPATLANAINSVYSPEREIESVLHGLERGAEPQIQLMEADENEDLSADDAQAAPVVRLTNMILSDAIDQGASDIHLQPRADAGVVRVRVDGVLRDQFELPLTALNRVVSRIKIMGGLDITNRLRPQDGRSRVGAQDRAYDLRISTIPTREADARLVELIKRHGMWVDPPVGVTEAG